LSNIYLKKNIKLIFLFIISFLIFKFVLLFYYHSIDFGEYDVFDNFSSRILASYSWLTSVNIYEATDHSPELKKLPLYSLFFSLNKFFFYEWKFVIKLFFILFTLINLSLFYKYCSLKIKNNKIVWFSVLLFVLGFSLTSDITLWMDSFYGNFLISSMLILLIFKKNINLIFLSSILFCLAFLSRVSVIYITPIFLILFIFLINLNFENKYKIRALVVFIIPIILSYSLLVAWNFIRTNGEHVVTTNASTGLMISILKLDERSDNLIFKEDNFSKKIFNFSEYDNNLEMKKRIEESHYLKSRLINLYFIRSSNLSHIEISKKTKNLFYDLMFNNPIKYAKYILLPNLKSSSIYISSSYMSPTSRFFELLWYDDKYKQFKETHKYKYFQYFLIIEKLIFLFLILFILILSFFKKNYMAKILDKENIFLFLFAFFWCLIHLFVGIEARYLYPINWIIIFLINHSLAFSFSTNK
jgi:hypothetical protein